MNIQELNRILIPIIPVKPLTEEYAKLSVSELKDKLEKEAIALYEEKEKIFPTLDEMREIERVVIL